METVQLSNVFEATTRNPQAKGSNYSPYTVPLQGEGSTCNGIYDGLRELQVFKGNPGFSRGTREPKRRGHLAAKQGDAIEGKGGLIDRGENGSVNLAGHVSLRENEAGQP